MKRITLENAFRTVFRLRWPQDPALADQVTLFGMTHCPRDPATQLPIDPAARAAYEAYDLVKAAIVAGAVNGLHGCLPGQLCGDIGPGEITARATFDLFANTLYVAPGRTYHSVCCSASDIEALIGTAAATSGVTKDRPVTSRVEACRPLIEAPGASTMRRADILTRAQNEIPGLLVKEFDAAWEMYASAYQKRPGARPRCAAGG